MGWIITALLSIILAFLIFNNIKLKKERDEHFKTYIENNITLVEEAEKERREELNKIYKELNQRLGAETNELLRKKEKAGYEYREAYSKCSYEKEKLEQTITDGKRIVDAEIEVYRQKQMQETFEAITISTEEATKAFELFQQNIAKQKQQAQCECDEIQAILDDFRKRRAVINEAILREKEIQEKEDFYRINLTKNDLDDMSVLEGIAPKMKNRDIIPKLIWDSILRRPIQEMIKRVTGGKDICGIYKVTYLKTGESYIGKTTDIKTRWQNHCKTAIGLEAAASSTFHTRLAADGIENYTWEILEEVSKDKLGEREKYWIEFYETNKNGLNMRVG